MKIFMYDYMIVYEFYEILPTFFYPIDFDLMDMWVVEMIEFDKGQIRPATSTWRSQAMNMAYLMQLIFVNGMARVYLMPTELDVFDMKVAWLSTFYSNTLFGTDIMQFWYFKLYGKPVHWTNSNMYLLDLIIFFSEYSMYSKYQQFMTYSFGIHFDYGYVIDGIRGFIFDIFWWNWFEVYFMSFCYSFFSFFMVSMSFICLLWSVLLMHESNLFGFNLCDMVLDVWKFSKFNWVSVMFLFVISMIPNVVFYLKFSSDLKTFFYSSILWVYVTFFTYEWWKQKLFYDSMFNRAEFFKKKKMLLSRQGKDFEWKISLGFGIFFFFKLYALVLVILMYYLYLMCCKILWMMFFLFYMNLTNFKLFNLFYDSASFGLRIIHDFFYVLYLRAFAYGPYEYVIRVFKLMWVEKNWNSIVSRLSLEKYSDLPEEEWQEMLFMLYMENIMAFDKEVELPSVLFLHYKSLFLDKVFGENEKVENFDFSKVGFFFTSYWDTIGKCFYFYNKLVFFFF